MIQLISTIIFSINIYPIKLLIESERRMTEESIYNIIPKEYRPQPKLPIYRSKYPHDIPPTGSTFCHKTTSKPGVSNLSGEFQLGLQAHTQHGNRSTMGYLKHDRRPSPDNFRKKNTGTMGNSTLPPVRNFSYDCSHKKTPVPKAHQKPVFGLKSGKNFIVSNAIQNIISNAKKIEEQKNWKEKKDFGKVPQYLSKIKESIHQEYKMIQNLHQSSQQKKQMLTQEEVQQLRAGLKQRWNEINKEYQMMTHVKLLDTTGLRKRREDHERQLHQIQQDIKKLNKAYIFVE